MKDDLRKAISDRYRALIGEDNTTEDLYEAARDEDDEPIHADGCACVRCTGGRFHGVITYIRESEN